MAVYAEPVPPITIIPILFDIVPGLPVAEVVIQGRAYLLAVNTGMADHLSLKPAALERLRCVELDSYTTIYDVDGARTRAAQYVVDDVDIAGLRLNRVIVSQELRSLFPQAIDGSIGRSLLSGFRVVLDYPSSRVELHMQGSSVATLAQGEWASVPFVLDHRGIILEGGFEGSSGSATLCLDTGCAIPAGGTYHGTIRSGAGLSTISNAADESSDSYRIVAGVYEVGSTSLGELSFVVNDYRTPFDGIIGTNYLAQRQVVLDFGRRIMHVRR